MADKALPIIFLNLSGEMIYVIQQRLHAQKIVPDKSVRVIQDIMSAMLNDQFTQELFTPQSMYSRSAMQSVFEKLVHSSIMRLNNNSMAKLYDLMLMVFKYQVINCEEPEDLLFITLNHLDALRDCTDPYPNLKIKLEKLHTILIQRYKDMLPEDYESLYTCVVSFLEDLNIRVSVLMKLGLQSQTGEIVKVVDSNKLNGHSGGAQTENKLKTRPSDCYELYGRRGTNLGTNIYLISVSSNTYTFSSSGNARNFGDNSAQAVDEINLLGRLIGRSNPSDYVPEIIFFDEDAPGEMCNNSLNKDGGPCLCVNIDASRDHQSELGRISNDFSIKEDIKGQNDILELLDIADNA